MFTVHYRTSSVLSSVGHGSVDPEARSAENFENRSGEEFHVNSLLLSLRKLACFRQLLVELFGASFWLKPFSCCRALCVVFPLGVDCVHSATHRIASMAQVKVSVIS